MCFNNGKKDNNKVITPHIGILAMTQGIANEGIKQFTFIQIEL